MRRVLIVGCPGAGKSTAAKQLAEITSLPSRPPWIAITVAGLATADNTSWRKTIDGLLSQTAWIRDSNYSGTLEQRLKSPWRCPRRGTSHCRNTP